MKGFFLPDYKQQERKKRPKKRKRNPEEYIVEKKRGYLRKRVKNLKRWGWKIFGKAKNVKEAMVYDDDEYQKNKNKRKTVFYGVS